jgi:hypothetical protein
MTFHGGNALLEREAYINCKVGLLLRNYTVGDISSPSDGKSMVWTSSLLPGLVQTTA